jgi:putative inorganic carbon (hco3(-)) transporter
VKTQAITIPAGFPPRPAGIPAAAPPVSNPYPSVPLALTGAFSLYIVVWFLEFGKRVEALGALRFEFLLGGGLVVAALIAITARVESNTSRLTKFICLYFAFLLFHLALSRYFWISWDVFVERLLKFSCMALFIYAFVRSPRTLRIFVFVLMLVFFKLGSEAFLGKVTGSMVWENQGIMRLNGQLGSRFGHPNSLSGLAVGTLPFIYYLFPVVSRKWRLGLLVLLAFAVNIIIFTGSRTGYLATIALAGFLWMRSGKKGRFLAALVIVAAVGLPYLPDQYEGRFKSAFVGQEIEGRSKAGRLEIAGDAWQLFLENPQGLGIYSFRSARVELLGKADYDTHNLYLQVMVDLGVVGTVVFGLLIVGLWQELRSTDLTLARAEGELRAALARAPARSEEGQRHLADICFMRATAAAFLAYVFARLVMGLFGHDLYEIYWWLAAGASIAIVNMQPIAVARTAEIIRRTMAPQPPPVAAPRRAPLSSFIPLRDPGGVAPR